MDKTYPGAVGEGYGEKGLRVTAKKNIEQGISNHEVKEYTCNSETFNII